MKGEDSPLGRQQQNTRLSKIEEEKKEREYRAIEQARKYGGELFPPGKLCPGERPDWRIPAAKIGIEVTDLPPPTAARARFSGPELASFQREVVEDAWLRYRDLCGAPADVLVYFKNEWRRKRNASEMAEALARFVYANRPADNASITLRSLTRNWVEGLSVVRIWARDGTWQAAGCGDVVLLTYEHLGSRIAQKNSRVNDYRGRLPGWQMWLLIATSFSVLWSVAVPLDVTNWRYHFDFDRVLLSDWERGVIELQRSNA